jgi:hypothetical protein
VRFDEVKQPSSDAPRWAIPGFLALEHASWAKLVVQTAQKWENSTHHADIRRMSDKGSGTAMSFNIHQYTMDLNLKVTSKLKLLPFKMIGDSVRYCGHGGLRIV